MEVNIIPVAILLVISILLTFVVSTALANLRWKKEAVSRGYGEYVLVDGGPETEFRWKDKP